MTTTTGVMAATGALHDVPAETTPRTFGLRSLAETRLSLKTKAPTFWFVCPQPPTELCRATTRVGIHAQVCAPVLVRRRDRLVDGTLPTYRAPINYLVRSQQAPQPGLLFSSQLSFFSPPTLQPFFPSLPFRGDYDDEPGAGEEEMIEGEEGEGPEGGIEVLQNGPQTGGGAVTERTTTPYMTKYERARILGGARSSCARPPSSRPFLSPPKYP